MRSKMPWIHKRETQNGSRWDVRVYVGGDKPYIYKTFATEKEAKKWARQQEDRKDAGERPTRDKRTLAEYLTWWLARKEEGSVRDRNGKLHAAGPQTMAGYRLLLTEWIITPKKATLPLVGRTRMDRVSYHTLNDLYEAMKKETTVGTIKKLHRVLGQVFVEAVEKGSLGRNPADLANVPQVTTADASDDEDDDGGDSSAKAMNQDEADRFLAVARAIADDQERERNNERFIPERCWSALWHVLLGSGLRPGEALALQWPDVKEDGKAIQVRRKLVRIRGMKGYKLERPKTKKSRRVVPLPPTTSHELMRWRTQQKRQRLVAGEKWQDFGFVFTTSKGTPLYGARRSFERVCGQAGLGEWGDEPQRQHPTGPLPDREFTPAFRIYDLRHTYASLLLMNGVPVNVVADLLGHEKASFTIARYGHALPKQTQDAPLKLESLLFKTA